VLQRERRTQTISHNGLQITGYVQEGAAHSVASGRGGDETMWLQAPMVIHLPVAVINLRLQHITVNEWRSIQFGRKAADDLIWRAEEFHVHVRVVPDVPATFHSDVAILELTMPRGIRFGRSHNILQCEGS
jgi:hypothetical protein